MGRSHEVIGLLRDLVRSPSPLGYRFRCVLRTLLRRLLVERGNSPVRWR